MKISIQLEVPPDEVQLASELLLTLRTLTDHVKGAAPPVIRNTKELFMGLINRLQNPAELEQVANEVATLLRAQSGVEADDDLARQFGEAFEQVVLGQEAVMHASVMPFMMILPKLPEPFKTKERDLLIAKVLQHLTKKRNVNVERTAFFAHAEAFAVLVKIEYVSVDGAVQTIEKLLSKSDTRSAAVTMLGKTVELCADRLHSCDHFQGLLTALAKVREPAFQYDIDWVHQAMGIARPGGQGHGTAAGQQQQQQQDHAPAVSAGAGGAAPQQHPQQHPPYPVSLASQPRLTVTQSYLGHNSTIFSMCYDSVHNYLVSGDKDGHVVVWGEGGNAIHSIDIPTHYLCSMDHHPSRNMLIMCGVASEAGGGLPPIIALYDSGRGFSPAGLIERKDATLVSCIRCMPQADGFVTGESLTTGSSGGLQEMVCYYDLSRLGGGGAESQQPVHVYQEHENLVTCVATCSSDPNLFVSGSRDETIRVWDRRAPACVGIFGVRAADNKIRAHEDMITCIDTRDNMLLSTGLDGNLCFWDFRALGMSHSPSHGPVSRISIDQQPVLKVATANSPSPNLAAISSFSGLYLIDFTDVASPAIWPAMHANDGAAASHYHDIKWGSGAPLLYGAGEKLNLDVLQLV